MGFRPRIWIFFLIGCVFSFTAFGIEKLALKDLVELGVLNSPTLAQFRADLEIKKYELSNAHYAFFPTLDLTSSHGLRGTRPSSTPSTWASEFQLALNETLYDNGRNWVRRQSAELSLKASELEYINQRDRLALSIAQEFLQYSLVQHLEEVQKSQVDILKKQFNTVARQYRQGVKSRKDFLRLKTELRRAEIDVRSTVRNTLRSQIELARLVGKPSEDFQLARVEPDLDTVKDIPREAPDLSSHYQFQIADLQRKVFENNVYLVQRNYWPQVTLTAGLSYGASNYLGTGFRVADVDQTVGFALINLNFNLFDWGRRKRDIAIAKETKARQERALDQSLNTFQSENRRMLTDLNQNRENYQLSRELLDMEKDSYELLQREYRNGRVSYLDLIVALRDLLNAKTRVLTAFFGLRSELYRYQYHQGKLYETLRQN